MKLHFFLNVQVQPAPPTMMATASVASNMNQNNSYRYVTSSQANSQQQLPTADVGIMALFVRKIVNHKFAIFCYILLKVR